MTANLTNHRKTVLLIGNILDDNVRFGQEDCVVVQKFEYVFERTCNTNGIPTGTTINPVVEFSFKFMDDAKPKSLFKYLNSMELIEITFLFNVSYNDNRKISDYDNAIVMKGYVVEVEQDYHYSGTNGEESQRIMKVKLLAADVTYVDDRSCKTLVLSDRR